MFAQYNVYMSYVHEWMRPRILDEKRFILFSKDVKSIVQSVGPRWMFFGGLKIGGSSGWGWPIINEHTVCFNGRPSMETFWIEQDHLEKYKNAKSQEDGYFADYVATGRKPYDKVVVASLLALRFHFPEVKIASDGGFTEWKDGHELFESATGQKINLPVQSGDVALVRFQ